MPEFMSNRIRRIHFICNNYDRFALEEDGHIEEQIAAEYMQLGLSNPPKVTIDDDVDPALWPDTSAQYDLTIRFCKGRVLVEHEGQTLEFVWKSQTDLIIAIVKLLEDRMNAETDILQGGVRAILLVEDSVRYYSTYLPELYRLIFRQNQIAIRDALNEQQQLLRKRARPKVLMATCLDEAEQLYARYKQNIIGVISDIGFVAHQGDDPSTEISDAGIRLTRMIRRDNPTMPVLLQSSQASMRVEAEKLGVGFIQKQSKNLTRELAQYIEWEFCFGDFLIRNRHGEVLARARDLEQFENLLRQISDDEFIRLTSNNYMSKWLLARGLFEIGREVQAHRTTADNVGEGRAQLVAMIHDYRIRQALGVVALYDRETYNDTIWFSRVGTSALGGKARGLAFLNHILQKYNLYNRWDDVRVMVPRTMVITTDYFDRFIEDNGLQDVINSDLTDEEILGEFVTSGLPDDLIEALRSFVRVTHCPLAIRSSSKLEDNYYQPFAGVYATYMIPNTENEDQTMRLLKKAIKSVFASVYMASARGYIVSSGNMISEEKMAVVLQEVCGEPTPDGRYFLPTLSGVARSVNFYPVGNEQPEDGICKVAYGLGKAVVDGDVVLRFDPHYPQHVMQTSTPEHTTSETQRKAYALSLNPERFKTSVDDAVNLSYLDIADCESFPSLRRVASTFDMQNMRIVDSCFPDGPRFVTFAPILKYNTFPLADIVRTLLDIAAREMKTPVEIEFAATLSDTQSLLNVLQIRPISADSLEAHVDWESIDTTHSFISSHNALGIGEVPGVYDVIYLRRKAWDVLRTREMAQTIRLWNSEMRESRRGYLLVGYGRWGSCISSLGVPVIWSDISEARAIVEASLPDFRVDPSQGSHFFQNLTSFNVGYIHVDPFADPDECYDDSVLDALPAYRETDLVRWVRLEQPLGIWVDGYQNKAIVKF